MGDWEKLAGIRREYGTLSLEERALHPSPFIQFNYWYEEVLQREAHDPTAMTLSTVDHKGRPDSRIVLLKGIEEEAFIFYSNYESKKGVQLAEHPYAALNFYWPEMARQVRIQGRVKQLDAVKSDLYFSLRPPLSQLSALVSAQSRPLKDRQTLEKSFEEAICSYKDKAPCRPAYWGGYAVKPFSFEFWQGRDNRLHDRIYYFKQKGNWVHQRLAP